MGGDDELESLRARLRILEDREAIRELKARYCDICDDGHDPDRITEIFAADGVWESSRNGRYEGHDQIRAQFATFGKIIDFSQHMVMNPIIDVTGDTASGRWYFLAPMVVNGAERWSFVRYDDRYVRIGEEWKFAHSLVTLRLDAPFHGQAPTAAGDTALS